MPRYSVHHNERWPERLLDLVTDPKDFDEADIELDEEEYALVDRAEKINEAAQSFLEAKQDADLEYAETYLTTLRTLLTDKP